MGDSSGAGSEILVDKSTLAGTLRRRCSSWLIGGITCFLILSAVSGQELTLEAAYSRFLDRSPRVAAEKEKLQMARGRVRQSQAWANPTMNFTQEGYPVARTDSTFDDQEFLLWATQEFELGGQRGKRRELAQLDLDAEAARYEDFLRRKRLDLSRLFVRAYFAARSRESLGRGLERYSQILETHRRRYEMGEVSGLAQMKIEAEELGYLIGLSRAEREFTSAWSELASMIVWDEDHLPGLGIDESPPTDLLDSSVFVSRALASRPDLKNRQIEAEAAEAALKVEKAKNIPNLNLGGGYKRDFGQNSFFVGVQLPLPLWDRRQGAIAEKIASSHRQRMLSDWKKTWIRYEVERAYGIFSRLVGASRRLNAAFLQKLDRIVDITALSYQEGEAGILEYLDALRTRRDASLEQNQLLVELHIARLELEASVGIPLRDIKP